MYAFWQYCCKYWLTKQISQRDPSELHYIILGIIFVCLFEGFVIAIDFTF